MKTSPKSAQHQPFYLLILLLLGAAGAVTASAAERSFAGRPLPEALDLLREDGLRIVYSTSVVRDDMRVEAEPEASEPRAQLDEMLEPHGLEIEAGPGGRLLVVRAVQAADDVHGDPDESRPAAAGPEVAMRGHTIDEIEVISHFSLLDDSASSGVSLDRADIAAMPHFGDDLNRAISVLPGVANDDYTAGFNVRGDLDHEVLVRLDGLELFEPYHLKDFEGLFSIFDPRIMASIDLVPGSFTAEFGDRSSGLLDMRSLQPTDLRGEIGASFSGAWASGAGRLRGDQGSWLVSARRGYLDVLLDLADEDEDEATPDPEYWDVFGKLSWDLSPGHSLALHALTAADSLDFFEQPEPGETTTVDTDFDDSYLWLAHRGVIGRRAFVDTVLSGGVLDKDRVVLAVEEGFSFNELADITDRREVDVLGLRQSWTFQPADRHQLKLGFEARSFDVRFRYSADVLREDPIGDPRFELPDGAEVRFFSGEFESEPLAVWASERLRLGSLVAELGVRWDRDTLVDEEHFSPRLNLLWSRPKIGALRLGWGHFYQSVRAHELEVEFGETRHQPPQRAEHLSLSWERSIAGAMTVRVEGYRREIDDPHARFETLFDPFKPAPQIAIDLIQVQPESARSQGVEVVLRGRERPRLGWWLSYARSEVTERVAGRDQRRYFDQPDALRASLSYRFGERWSVAGLWRFHTGWPTTAVRASRADEPGAQVVFEVGPFYAERLADYHSLDFRISRTAEIGEGRLALFVDVQNLYNHRNERGLDVEDFRSLSRQGDRFEVAFSERKWLGLLPSFGLSWRF